MKVTMTLEIEIEFTGKYHPAVEGNCSLNSLPENCFPGEPSEFDVEDIKIIIPQTGGKFKYINCPNEISDLIDYEDILGAADNKYEE